MPAHPVGGVTMPAAAPLSHGEILATMAEEMDACAIAASERAAANGRAINQANVSEEYRRKCAAMRDNSLAAVASYEARRDALRAGVAALAKLQEVAAR